MPVEQFMYRLNFISSSKIPYIIIPQRQEHLDDEEEYKAEILEELEEEGVDTTFRETSGFYRANSVQQNYTEELFGDDGYEKTKRALLKRVADETRSFPVIDVDYYMYREAASLARNEELAKKFKETVHKPSFLRCKIAYKDLSKDKKEPIMIRTR